MSDSIPESTLFAGLDRVVEQLGRAPPVMESIKHGTHAHQTIARRFGGDRPTDRRVWP